MEATTKDTEAMGYDKKPNPTRRNLLGLVGIQEAEEELRSFDYNDPAANHGVRGNGRQRNTYDNSKERRKRALLVEELRVRLCLSIPSFCDRVGITTYKYNHAVIHQTTDFSFREWDCILNELGLEAGYQYQLKYYTKTIQGLPKKTFEHTVTTLRREYKENAEKRKKD